VLLGSSKTMKIKCFLKVRTSNDFLLISDNYHVLALVNVAFFLSIISVTK